MSDASAPRWDPIWRIRIRPVRLLLAIAIGFAILILAAPALLTSYARWLVKTDPPREAEVAVILGGGEGERLAAGLRIWREGRVPAVLITGPAVPFLKVYTGEDSLTQGEAKRRIAIRKGVPEENVWLALGPTSTYEEAVLMREVLEQRGVRNAIVVTSPFHSRRAGQTFRHLFRGSPIRLTLETLPEANSADHPDRWWRREYEMMSVFSETMKILFYWWRYGVPPV